MPVTPFHFGPGFLIKSIFKKHFNFWVFVVSQIVMDSEVAWNIYRENERWHTFFHTYLGSFVAVGITFILFKIIWPAALKILEESQLATSVSSHIVLFSALIGCWTHVLLDSFMHKDIQPWWPFYLMNPWQGALSLSGLHLFCIISGALGLILYPFWGLGRLKDGK